MTFEAIVVFLLAFIAAWLVGSKRTDDPRR